MGRGRDWRRYQTQRTINQRRFIVEQIWNGASRAVKTHADFEWHRYAKRNLNCGCKFRRVRYDRETFKRETARTIADYFNDIYESIEWLMTWDQYERDCDMWRSKHTHVFIKSGCVPVIKALLAIVSRIVGYIKICWHSTQPRWVQRYNVG